MLKYIAAKNMHRGKPTDWLDTIHHFSFAQYYNPNNMNFGSLRVLNDDLIAGHSGFNTHPHKDMEIVSYLVEGALTHRDSIGNEGVIRRGEVQYMSAGRGIYHSEINEGAETVRLLQLWILPNAKNLEPNYGEYKYKWEERENKLLHFVSPQNGSACVKLHQDVNLYATELEKGKTLDFPLPKDRQCYIVQIEGASLINGVLLEERDALEAVEEDLKIEATTSLSHLLFIEMGTNNNHA
ncbi:MAG: pirin family protein [Defluviitaleaceae bacterium]|nr:pirin family protein [Defluviitaleaceae bacterium]